MRNKNEKKTPAKLDGYNYHSTLAIEFHKPIFYRGVTDLSISIISISFFKSVFIMS